MADPPALDDLIGAPGYESRDRARLLRALGTDDEDVAAGRLQELGRLLARDAADWCIGRSPVSVPSDFDLLLARRLLEDVRGEDLHRPRRGIDRRLTDELGLSPSRARTVQQRFPPPPPGDPVLDAAVADAIQDLDSRLATAVRDAPRYRRAVADDDLVRHLNEFSQDELARPHSVYFRGDPLVQRLVRKAYGLVLYDATRDGQLYRDAKAWQRENEGYSATLRTWLYIRAALPTAREAL